MVKKEGEREIERARGERKREKGKSWRFVVRVRWVVVSVVRDFV